jgi:phosphoribosylanthranilate isomerase
MKVKICGITRVDDALRAAELGADFLGFIFVPGSPRFIEFETAAAIVARVRGPKFVGVFRDAQLEVMQAAPVDYIQLHGNETDAVARAVGKPVIKAIQVEDRQSCLSPWADGQAGLPVLHEQPEWLLFDSKGGGSGTRFDWSLLAAYPRTKPFLLAGGITPDNVALAVSTVRPDGIDVASGVESSPGIKDHQKLKLLFERVK